MNKECMFAKFGLEVPDFPCEIFETKQDNILVGWASDSMHPFESVMWNYKGKTIKNHQSHYNLTPIEKPWYKEESNFPCLVMWHHTIREVSNGWVPDVIMKYESNKFIARNGTHFTIDQFEDNTVRLATEEEVLSLFKDVK